MNNNDAIIRTERLTKVYDDGHSTVALQDVSLEIPRGSLSFHP